MKKIIIDKYSSNQRVDKFILKFLDGATKSFVYKMFRKKRIKLNDKKIMGNEILKPDDKITFYISKETIESFQKKEILNTFSIPLDIIFEDDNILIVNKPVGLLSHGATKDDENLNDAIVNYLIKTNQYDILNKTFKPSICNRLDRNTSGLIISSKNLLSAQSINNAIKNKNIERFYLTIVKGDLKIDDTITNYLVKNKEDNKVTLFDHEVTDSKKIISYFKTLENNKNYSLVSVKLITGKSHQIRSQLGFLGYPVIGDNKYGDSETNLNFSKKYKLKSQLLHCNKIILKNIENFDYLNDKEFSATESEIFKNIYNDLFKI